MDYSSIYLNTAPTVNQQSALECNFILSSSFLVFAAAQEVDWVEFGLEGAGLQDYYSHLSRLSHRLNYEHKYVIKIKM